VKRLWISICSTLTLAGCASLGFIDDQEFASLVRQGRCQEANILIAKSNCGSAAERWSYMGRLEYFCYRNQEAGIELLNKAASRGDLRAMTTLARIGERLPEDVSSGSVGAPRTTVDVHIHK
jgi:hypothetical protein